MNIQLPKFLRWALTSLFPAGADPWSGTSTTANPPYEHFTPGVPPATQEMNYLLNLLGEEAKLIATVPMGGATKFASAGSIVSGATTLDYLTYDADGGVWLAVGNAAPSLVASIDNGQGWTTVATPASQVLAMGNFTIAGNIQPTDALLILGGAAHVFYYQAATGTLVDSGGTQGVTASGGGCVFGLPTTTPAAFGFTWDSTNHRTRCFVSTGPASFASLTLPNSWQNGPQNSITYFTYGVGPNFDALVAWGGPTTGTSYILHATIGSVWPNTPTMADLTLPAGMSTKSIVGVAYNTTTGQWGAMVWDGTNSALWTTTDLVSWTQQALQPGQAAGLVTVGPYWVTVLPHLGLPDANSYQTLYTLDGQTWFRGAGHSPAVGTRLAQAKGGYAFWSTVGGVFSLNRVG